MITTVTLNPTIDIVAPVSGLKPGSVSRTKSVYSYPGGKGTNVARALASLGCDVEAAGFVGIRDSRETSHFLGHHGVSSSPVPCIGSNRICLLITDTGKHPSETVINSESDIGITKKEVSALYKVLKSLGARSSHMVFSGSLPLGVPASFYAGVIALVREKCGVILDTSSKYLMHGIKARPHIIKQNVEELRSAFGLKLSGRAAIKRDISALSRKHSVPVIITTMNEKGALLFDRGSFVFFPPLKVKNIVSPVGSGDAFSAGLAYGLSKGMDMEQSCGWGMACAAANLTHLGSCFINKKDVFSYLKKVRPSSY